jgi:hypothetical protein
MRKLTLLCVLLCATTMTISASPVHAQFIRYVASNGSNANASCSQIDPCATFQGVIDKGLPTSQINCLNSGTYAAVTITQSITIDCGAGTVGAISVSSGGTAITISTPAGATVVLRHLGLNGVGVGAFGIRTTSFPSGTLIVEDCMIQGFHGGYGIGFTPSAGRGLLQVSNSQIFDNFGGILVSPTSGQIASVTLNNVELVANSGFGLVLTGPGVVAGTMRDSVAGSNGNTGVYSDAIQAFFTVEDSSIDANLTNGIQTNSAGSVLNVAASTIGGNGTGVRATLGSLISFGDNHMSANGSNGSFTATTPLQ